jgi:hypothetical protein
MLRMASLVMLTSTLLLAPGAPAKPADADHAGHFMQCAKACADCQQMCDSCYKHCLTKTLGGGKEHGPSAEYCVDCAECCKLAATLSARQSPLSGPACECCAKCCDECAASCEKMPDDQHMTQCAKQCRECAKVCRAMVKHVSQR